MPGTDMIRSLIIISMVLISVHSNSQTRLGIPLPDTAIIPTKSVKGYLYAGMDNPIRYQFVEQYKYDTIIITCNNGFIYLDSLTLVTNPSRSGKSRMHAYGMNGSDTTDLGYIYFTVKSIPPPQLTLNNKPLENPTTLYKSELLRADSLGICFSDDIIGSEKWVQVQKFELGYNYGGFYVSHLNNSNKFSYKTKQLISRIGPDRQITIRPTLESSEILQELPIYRITLY